MKIFVCLLMFLISFAAIANEKFICSEKLGMNFVGSYFKEGKNVILHGDVVANLTFDIGDIDQIFVFAIKFKKNTGTCVYKSVEKSKRTFVQFNAPVDFKELKIDVRIPPDNFIINGVRNYMFVVSKMEKSERAYYFKNFSFIEEHH